MKIRYMTIFLILLVCLVGAVSAADDVADDTLDVANGDAVAVDNVQEEVNEKVNEEVSTGTDDTSADDTLQAQDNNDELKSTNENETIATTTDDDILKEQNNQEPLKSGTKTVEVNDYNELKNALNDAVEDTADETYIINLKEGTYELDFMEDYSFWEGSAKPNIIINANNQELTEMYPGTCFQFFNNCNITLNDAHLKHGFDNYNDLNVITIRNSIINLPSNVFIQNMGTLTIINSTINGGIKNMGVLNIADDVTFGDNFNFMGNEPNIDDKNKIAPYLATYNGNYILENITITSTKTNNGNLTIRNSTINAQITNNGILTIADDVIFGSKFGISGNGQILTNKSMAPYLSVYDGNYILENITITSTKTNNGNLTIRNSTINAQITNNGILTIADDVTFGNNFVLRGNGQIIINNTNRITPYMIVYNGDYTLENTIISSKTNNGNLTVINCTFNAMFVNNGNLFIKNSTINSEILNYGKLTISDDVVFGASCVLSGNGEIVINDTNKIVPYLTTLNGDYLIENLTIKASKTNNGNLTIRNSTITGTITNNGNLTIENSSTTNTITNKGTLILKNTTVNRIQNTGTVILYDDVTFGPSFYITGGHVIANDYNKIFSKLGQFNDEATVELGVYNNYVQNYGNLTIENTTFNNQVINSGKITIVNSTANTPSKPFSNSGTMEFKNCTINVPITNTGILIISEDTILGENFQIKAGWGGVEGQVITNNTQLIDYVDFYKGDIVLSNKTINTPKTNKGRLTLNNCTINSIISNDGIIIIDEDTVFGENAKIAGTGEIKINDLSRILPIIDTINGNYEIKDTELTKNYAFNGDVTLINCTITNPDNTNFGTLKLNNCTVNVGEENTFLINYGTVTISKDTKITGKIINLVENGVIYEGAPKTYIVTQDTIGYFFDEAGLTSIVNPGDTLNIQGTIKLNRSLTIDKPVNIISTTKDAYIDLNTTAGDYFGSNQGNKFAITKDGAYTNVTGIYFHNTQLWLFNTDHVTLDGISAVVENQRVGSGVGVTSIRQNSSYITVKNSYFYTKDNEGSSTLVLAWANYCTIENNTIVGVGNVGNLLYLTTYNVNIPQGSMFNSHNKLINNRITGPESAAICYGICISGYDNLVDNNTITYSGAGITSQWGSGVTGIEQAESLVGSGENIVSNNKLYGGCGISAGDLIYNNYMEGTLAVPANSIAYNNTAKGLELMGNASEVSNSTIAGQVTFADGVTNAIVENNNITGDITIPTTATKNTLKGNDIKGQIILDGSDNTITNNTIVSGSDYAISSNKLGKNNNITANEVSANGKTGNDAISLRDPSNIVAGNVKPKTADNGTNPTGDNGTNPVKPVTPTKPTTPAKKPVIKISAKNKANVDYGFTYKVRVTSNGKSIGAGKQVTLKVGKTTLKAKTDKNGYATFTLAVKPATYTVTATYNKVSQKYKITVKNVIQAKNLKVKKSAKKLKVKVTLKTSAKKPIKGKKVTIKINGKKITAKTNKKGLAKFTINKKILKKLKAGKKYKYQVIYGKDTVTKNLKVKK